MGHPFQLGKKKSGEADEDSDKFWGTEVYMDGWCARVVYTHFSGRS